MGVWSESRGPFFNFCPDYVFVIGEVRHFEFRVLIDTEEYECMHDILLPKGMCSNHVTSLNFGKYVIISWKQCKRVTQFQWKTNRKSYVVYQIKWHHCQCP